MSDFRQLSDSVWASPQIGEAEVAEAARRGFAMIVNNRPDGEAEDQPSGDFIERAAQAAGLDYRAIAITHAGFNEAQVEAMSDALETAQGPVLAYCRSGTRSTLLWSLAQAAQGRDPAEIAEAAARAGYDVAPIYPALEALVSRQQG